MTRVCLHSTAITNPCCLLRIKCSHEHSICKELYTCVLDMVRLRILSNDRFTLLLHKYIRSVLVCKVCNTRCKATHIILLFDYPFFRNQSANRLINQPINNSVCQSFNQSINYVMNDSVIQLVDLSRNQSVGQSVNQSINQSQITL